VYLMRVPIVVGAVFAALPWLATRTRAAALLLGLYDVGDGLGVWAVSATGFMLCLAIMQTLWLVAAYADQRCGAPALRVRYPIRRRWYVASALLALPTLAAIAAVGSPSPGRLLQWGIAGFLTAVLGFEFARWTTRQLDRVGLVRAIAVSLSRYEAASGYVDLQAGAFLPGHRLALGLMIASWLLYLALGRLLGANTREIPALAYALLFMLIVCWGAAGMAFFLDRYRLPLLLPIGALVAITGAAGGSDHYFQLRPSWYLARVSPAEALTAPRAGAASPQAAIVVAAQGGGIQAAAWTARVLTGLQAACRQEMHQACRFAPSIRAISSVSGGSVGAMYFAAEYRDGTVADAALEPVVHRAEASSLEHVGWGLLYRDVFRPFCPRFDYADRGSALEQAWQRDADLSQPLASWRPDVAAGRRPAMIFNATIADTGERFLISTAAPKEAPGRREFYSMFGDNDILVVTAARLSASFAYVSPAARADTNTEKAVHFVDGAYYDNYGTASLIDWLDEALRDNETLPFGRRVNRVLLLQVRGAPPDGGSEGRRRGWFYQTYAPLAALLGAELTGQLAHSDAEVALLQRAWAAKTRIATIIMQFCQGTPPLSWHMTANQVRDVESEWQREIERGAVGEVLRFLNAADLNERDSLPPLHDLPSRCQPVQAHPE